MTHKYDTDGLSPKDFLFAIMRDATAPICDRVQAAGHLLALDPSLEPTPIPVGDQDVIFTIKLPEWVQ
jgi:hypothetical protein